LHSVDLTWFGSQATALRMGYCTKLRGFGPGTVPDEAWFGLDSAVGRAKRRHPLSMWDRRVP